MQEYDNQVYRQGERGLDYLGLMLLSIVNGDDQEVPKGHPRRLAYVHDMLTNMIENVSHSQLVVLKEFLELHQYGCSIVRQPTEINFTIRTVEFDFIAIID